MVSVAAQLQGLPCVSIPAPVPGPGPGAVDWHKEGWRNGATCLRGYRIDERGARLNRHHTEVCGRGNSINRNV